MRIPHVLVAFFLLTWAESSRAATRESFLPLIPRPASVTTRTPTIFTVDRDKRLVVKDAALDGHARALLAEIRVRSGIVLEIAREERPGDLVLELDPKLAAEEYELTTMPLRARGRDVEAVSRATATWLQLLTLDVHGLRVPDLVIKDKPAYAYRGLLVDVARQPHSIESLEEIVDLCRFYKVRYLQLHLTDDQAFTFPSEALPELVTPGRGYTRTQLTGLVAYARDRGVTIVPEIEMPGHGAALIRAKPELFRLSDKHHATLNFAREEALVALEMLVAEVGRAFPDSPWIHIGGDEVDAQHAAENPIFQARMRELGVDSPQEVFRWFLGRMNAAVKRTGKRMIVWEGFAKDGKVDVPKDIVVMAFESLYHLPTDLVKGGWDVVNATWKPLYVVNALAWTPREILAWKPTSFEHFVPGYPAFEGLEVVECADRILGAQMCAWEQSETRELPSLRQRIAAFAERTWSGQPKVDADDFALRLRVTDGRFELFLRPVDIQVRGLDSEPDRLFGGRIEVDVAAPRVQGTVRQTLDGSTPSASSPVAPTKTQEFERSTTLRAALFDEHGQRIGRMSSGSWRHAIPRLEYAFYEAPHGGWSGLPDFKDQEPALRGKLDALDVTSRDEHVGFGMVFEGRFECATAGKRAFRLEAKDQARLSIDGRVVVVDADGDGASTGEIQLAPGVHVARVEFHVKVRDARLALDWETPAGRWEPVPWLPLSQSDAAPARAFVLAEDDFNGAVSIGLTGSWKGIERFGESGTLAPTSGYVQAGRSLERPIDAHVAAEVWLALTFQVSGKLSAEGNHYRNFSPLNGGQHYFLGVRGSVENGTQIVWNDRTAAGVSALGTPTTVLARLTFGSSTYSVTAWANSRQTEGIDPERDAPFVSDLVIPRRSIRDLLFNADGDPASTLVVRRMCFATSYRSALRLPESEGWKPKAHKAPDALDRLLERDSPMKDGARIAFLGDSITEAGGYIEMLRAALLEERPEWKVTLHNAGISGHKVTDLQARFERDVVAKKPDVLVIYVGINDVWHWKLNGKGTTREAYAAGLRDLVARARQAGMRVVLSTPSIVGEKKGGQNELDGELDAYSALVRSVAMETGSVVCDLRQAFQHWLAANNPRDLDSGLLTDDGVHMLPRGDELILVTMAEALHVLLRQNR